MNDYYAVLGIERTATKDEIKKAYRQLARLYHPDINKDAAKNDAVDFKEILEAYTVLSDEIKKIDYDYKYDAEHPNNHSPQIEQSKVIQNQSSPTYPDMTVTKKLLNDEINTLLSEYKDTKKTLLTKLLKLWAFYLGGAAIIPLFSHWFLIAKKISILIPVLSLVSVISFYVIYSYVTKQNINIDLRMFIRNLFIQVDVWFILVGFAFLFFIQNYLLLFMINIALVSVVAYEFFIMINELHKRMVLNVEKDAMESLLIKGPI